MLHIRRKPTLLLFKANIYIDGQYVGTISTREDGFDVPLSQGEHEIAISISENVGVQFEPFMDDSKMAGETARMIQSRMKLYLSEQFG